MREGNRGRREEERREEGGGEYKRMGGWGRVIIYLITQCHICGISILVSHLQCLMSGGLLRLGFLKYSPLLIGLVTLLETRV